MQKPWKFYLLGRRDEASKLEGFAEIETQLKQLYTAITRCIERLFFVETGDSEAGAAFVRWLTEKEKIATKQTIATTEQVVKTPDEWNALGMDYAMNADNSEELERTAFWLDKAANCFGEAKAKNLERYVAVHKASVELRREYEYKSYSEERKIDNDELEKTTKETLESLIDAGLLREARQLCDVMLPFLQERLRRRLGEQLVPLLPSED